MFMPMTPISPSRRNISRGGQPAASHCGYTGTTSRVMKDRTRSRKASCSALNRVRFIRPPDRSAAADSSRDQFDQRGVGGAAALAHGLQAEADAVVAHVVDH